MKGRDIAIRRDRLVDSVAEMIGRLTYNHAPINYTIAEQAIEMVEDFYRPNTEDFYRRSKKGTDNV